MPAYWVEQAPRDLAATMDPHAPDSTAEETPDGPRVYLHAVQGEWRIADANGMPGCHVRSPYDPSGRTLRRMFLETVVGAGFEFDILSADYYYEFAVSHPDAMMLARSPVKGLTLCSAISRKTKKPATRCQLQRWVAGTAVGLPRLVPINGKTWPSPTPHRGHGLTYRTGNNVCRLETPIMLYACTLLDRWTKDRDGAEFTPHERFVLRTMFGFIHKLLPPARPSPARPRKRERAPGGEIGGRPVRARLTRPQTPPPVFRGFEVIAYDSDDDD